MSRLIVLWLAAVLALGAIACDDLDETTPTPRPRTPSVGATDTVLPRTPTAPVSVSDQAPLEKGAQAEADEVRVVVLQISDPFKASRQAATPEAGYHYAQVAVQVENRGAADITTGFGAFSLVSSDGSARPAVRVAGVDPYFITQSIASEAVVQGLIVGEVKDGETLAGLTFDANDGTPDAITFGQAPSEQP
jgi:hypothetical protein